MGVCVCVQVCAYAYATCVQVPVESRQWRVLDPQNNRSYRQLLFAWHDAEHWTWVLWRSNKCQVISLVPLLRYLKHYLCNTGWPWTSDLSSYPCLQSAGAKALSNYPLARFKSFGIFGGGRGSWGAVEIGSHYIACREPVVTLPFSHQTLFSTSVGNNIFRSYFLSCDYIFTTQWNFISLRKTQLLMNSFSRIFKGTTVT